MANSEDPGGSPKPPPPVVKFNRNLPDWFDPQNDFIILQLCPVEGNNLPKNPFTVSKSLQLDGGDIEFAKTEARGTKYVIKVRGRRLAEKLMKLEKLIDGTPILITPHPQLNFVRCVVSCEDAIELEEDELLEELKKENVTNVRRISRKINNQLVKTATLVLTVAGTEKPDYIKFGLLRIPTRPYYPSPMLCYKCLMYGHTKARCSAEKEVCKNCSQEHDGECGSPSYCRHCKSGHSAANRKCPRYEREENICRMTVELKISFPEAQRIYESRQKQPTYAEISSTQQLSQKEIIEKDLLIQKLQNEISELKATCRTLQNNFQKAKSWIQRSQSQERNHSQDRNHNKPSNTIKIAVHPPKSTEVNPPTPSNKHSKPTDRHSRSLAPSQMQVDRSITPTKRMQSESPIRTYPPEKYAKTHIDAEHDGPTDIGLETEIYTTDSSQDMSSQH